MDVYQGRGGDVVKIENLWPKGRWKISHYLITCFSLKKFLHYTYAWSYRLARRMLLRRTFLKGMIYGWAVDWPWTWLIPCLAITISGVCAIAITVVVANTATRHATMCPSRIVQTNVIYWAQHTTFNMFMCLRLYSLSKCTFRVHFLALLKKWSLSLSAYQQKTSELS